MQINPPRSGHPPSRDIGTPRRPSGGVAATGLITACALLVALPLLVSGPSCGHDFDFHLQSWFAASRAWHSLLSGDAGPLYPHWAPGANYGAGAPRFVFYPPLSWAVGAALGAVLPWTAVPLVFTLPALAASGLAFFALARRWVRAPVAAGAACIYLANPYLLFVAYERSAYGELLGAVTMPLVVLFTLRRRPAVDRLAIVMAALWLTNAPAAVMGSYLLGFCALAAAAGERSWKPLVRALGALLLGIGIASVYVLPAWYEQRWIEIGRVIGPGMRVEDSFLFGHSGEAFHDQVLHTASWIVVVVLGVGFVAAFVGGFKARGGVEGLRLRVKLLNAVLGAMLVLILLLLLPVSGPVWRLAPELRFLQFPWRWMLVGGMAAALASAAAVEAFLVSQMGSVRRCWGTGRRLVAAQAGLAATLLAGAWCGGHYAHEHYAQSCDEEDNVRAQEALVGTPGGGTSQGGGGFEGTDEYTPRGADNGEIQQGLPAVRLLREPDEDEGDDTAAPNPDWAGARQLPGVVRVSDWSPEHKRFTIVAPGPGYAVLRLMDYPAWQVRVGDHVVSARPHREDGLMTIPIAAGVSTIEVSYGATGDVYVGRGISVGSVLLLGMLTARQRRRKALDSGEESERRLV